MSRWVYCRYYNELGRKVGLTFSYGCAIKLKDYFFRYRLSEQSLSQYKVYEDGVLIFELDRHNYSHIPDMDF